MTGSKQNLPSKKPCFRCGSDEITGLSKNVKIYRKKTVDRKEQSSLLKQYRYNIIKCGDCGAQIHLAGPIKAAISVWNAPEREAQ